MFSLAAMFASLAFYVAGTALLGTALALGLAGRHYSSGVVGLVLVCHSIGFVVGSRLSTGVIRRVGQVRSFAAFAAIGCAAALIHPMWVDAWLWAALRGLVGFCAAGLIMVLESWISARATNATRGALLGIYQVVYFFAAAVGQYLVAFTADAAFPVFSVVAILLVLSIVPMALTRAEAPTIRVGSRLGFAALYRLSPSGLMGGIAGGVIVSAFLSMAPVYATRIGMSLTDVSHYMALAVIATMLLQWPVGRLSDHVDRRWTLAAISVIATAGALLAAVLGTHMPWVLYAGTALFFGLAGCLYPVSLALLNDHMDIADGPMAASAGLLLAYGLGTCIGPLLSSQVMQSIGPAGLFWFMGLLFALYAMFVMVRGATTASLPVADQTRYVTINASQAVSALLDLDPRMPELASEPEQPASAHADAELPPSSPLS
jgi:MFS family permease